MANQSFVENSIVSVPTLALFAVTIFGWVVFFGEGGKSLLQYSELNWTPTEQTTIHGLRDNEWTELFSVGGGCVRYRTHPPDTPVSVNFRTRTGDYRWYKPSCLEGRCPQKIRLGVPRSARLFVERFNGADNPVCRKIYHGQNPWKKNELSKVRDRSAGGIVDRNMYVPEKRRRIEMPRDVRYWRTNFVRQEDVVVRMQPGRDCISIKKAMGVSSPGTFATWSPSSERWVYGDGCYRKSRFVALRIIKTSKASWAVVDVWRKRLGRCSCPNGYQD